MLASVRRQSLVAQTVDLIHQGIESRQWEDYLPGERELCQRLGISRPTLRAALELLEKQKYIETAQGKRRRIVMTSRRLPVADKPRVVNLLIREYAHAASTRHLFLISEMRSALYELGYRLEIHSETKFFNEHPERAIESFMHLSPARCWVIYSPSEKLQRWFFDRGVPVVLTGHTYPDIRLPALGVNYRAACRHAVATLARLGHRRMAFIIRGSGFSGDLQSEQGFREAAELAGVAPEAAPILHHDSSVEHIRRLLDGLLAGPQRPTAIVAAVPAHVITVATYLMNRGLNLPKDISLISRDDDNYFTNFIPSITRYGCDVRNHARRLCRLVARVAESGFGPARQYWLMPDQIRGQTVAPPQPSR